MTLKPLHYQGLDFLRGVAALAVVEFHLSSRLNLPEFFSHGYLAVDFFFTLSGFVIANAYSARIKSGAIGFHGFLMLRITRLLPLVFLGTVVAAITDLGRPQQGFAAQHLLDICAATIMGVLCVPTLWHTTLENTVFPLDSPVWSLFFELCANLAFVPLIRSNRPNRLISMIGVISVVALAGAVMRNGNANLGAVSNTFAFGFPRVAWSFAIGILLTQVRAPSLPRNKWTYALVLCVIMLVPQLPQGWSSLFDIVVISIIFPLIVLGAANCQAEMRHSALSTWSGNVSYPLYVIHYPGVRVVSVVSRQFADTQAVHLGVVVGSSVALLALSVLVYSFYDVPSRAWITQRLKAGKSSGERNALKSSTT